MPSPAPKQAILILGMHRSGTSALGGVISAMGAAEPKTLTPGYTWNPRGLFESSPLVVAHDQLLASLGSGWDDWRQLDPQYFQSVAAQRHRDKIKAVLLDEYGSQPLIFIKDPRICRFIPFLSSILTEMDTVPLALLSVRNPLEVAFSLEERDGFSLPKSQLLWLRHVLESEFNTRHMVRCFLSFQELLIDWKAQMNRVTEKCGITWPPRQDDPDTQIRQFLTTELYHHKATLEDTRRHQNIMSLVSTTYDILNAIMTDGESENLIRQLDLVRTRFDEACELCGPAVAAAELAVQKLRNELTARGTERDELIDRLSKLTAAYEAAVQRCDRVVSERNAMLESRSWRFTGPIRRMRTFFVQKS